MITLLFAVIKHLARLQKSTREERADRYKAALRDKYAPMPQIARIARHRQVPKHILLLGLCE